MGARAIKEIEAVFDFFDRYRIFLSAVLQNQLFKVQKGPFVRDLLADLYESGPGVFGGELGAIGALTMLYQVFNLECLFQHCVC